ncbi:MAG TPA: hypothetical protein VMP13_06250 [Acidimicrobiia bacterium]|nr:hypothetical protein [Acidimicrobiia bacterium]
MSVVGVARLVSSKTRIVEVDGPMGAKTSELYYAGEPRYRPAPVGFSIKKTGSKTRYLIEKGSACDQLLASLAEPKLAKPYTGRGWRVG